MIRALGFLTGIVVTGTAVWLLSDGVAAKAALDSLSAYLAESDSPGEVEAAVVEAERRILPPAAIMHGKARMPGLPAAIREASSAGGARDPIDAAPAVTDPPEAPEPTPGEAPGLGEAPGAGTAASDAADTPEPESPDPVADAGGQPDPPARDVGRASGEPSPAHPRDPMQLPEHHGESGPDPDPALAGEGSWFAFWTPFRSRASADGFARHLNQTTGQEIRVLRIGPGEYRVAFFHADEEERQRHLASLESASGLELGGEL